MSHREEIHKVRERHGASRRFFAGESTYQSAVAPEFLNRRWHAPRHSSPPHPGPLPHSGVHPECRIDCGGEGAEKRIDCRHVSPKRGRLGSLARPLASGSYASFCGPRLPRAMQSHEDYDLPLTPVPESISSHESSMSSPVGGSDDHPEWSPLSLHDMTVAYHRRPVVRC